MYRRTNNAYGGGQKVVYKIKSVEGRHNFACLIRATNEMQYSMQRRIDDRYQNGRNFYENYHDFFNFSRKFVYFKTFFHPPMYV